MYRGYIKLFRRLCESPTWTAEPMTRAQAWVDLLFLAQYKPSFFRVRGIRIDVPRGALGWSMVSLADRWQWSINKVKRFLNELKTDCQIEYQKNNLTTLIKIINYDSYQGNELADELADGKQKVEQTASRRQAEGRADELHIKKDNKDKNIKESKEGKEILLPDFIDKELWEDFKAKRKELKKPLSGKAEELAIAKLTKLKEEGHDPSDLLKDSIMNSWQGFYPRSNGNKHQEISNDEIWDKLKAEGKVK